MIRAIANQRLEISNEEYEYYIQLEKSFGKEAFIGLFKTNDAGRIVSVMPTQSSPTATILIFFFLNLMFNQRLRRFDNWMLRMESLEDRLLKLEERV